MDFFKELANIFFEHCNNSEDARSAFVHTALSHYAHDEEGVSFSKVVEELIGYGCEDSVYSYLIESFDGTHELGLSQIIAKISVDFSEEIIRFAIDRTTTEDGSVGINLNALLLNFINNNDKNSIDDFEAKVQSIIRCMNEVVKQQNVLLQQKDEEICELRMRLAEQVSPERVLAAIKTPLTDLEQHVALQGNSRNASRLVQIIHDFRNAIEDLYGISALESVSNWVSQTPVLYDPTKHKIADMPNKATEEIYVCVESLGFLLPVDGDEPQIVRANVAVKRLPQRGARTGKGRDEASTKKKEGKSTT